MDNFSYNPGSLAVIFLEIKDTDGYRADSLTTPVINEILGFTSIDGYTSYDGYFALNNDGYLDGYNQPLTRISVGLYYVKLTLPKTASSLGSYIVEILYTDPASGNPLIRSYQLIIVSAFGGFGTTTF